MWRFLKHLLFWIVIMLWTSTVYLSKETDGLEFLWFNLVRLPLIMMATYSVIYYLLPKFIFRDKAYTKFIVAFVGLFVLTTLLDRSLIGSDLIDTILKDTGLTYTFFNEIPLFRNAFLLVSIIGLATAIRLFNFYQKEGKVTTSGFLENKSIPLPAIQSTNQPNLTKVIANDFLLKSGTVTHKLNWKDIYFLEKDENYVIYHTKERRILERTTLSKLSTNLPKYFCRVHRSFIISFQQIDKIERDSLIINQQKIPIGRTYRANFLQELKQFNTTLAN